MQPNAEATMETTLERARMLSAPTEIAALDAAEPEFLKAADERERIAHELLGEANGFRQIVEGIRALRSADTPNGNGHAAATPPQANGNGNGHAEIGPRGTAAVRGVMREGGAWTIQSVHSQLVVRGWISEGTKHPQKATETAIHRLLKKGELERVGRGTYHYIGAPMSQSRLTSPDAERAEP